MLAILQLTYKNKKGLQKHDTLTLAHSELTPAEMVNDREWRQGQWMIKYFKVLLHRFVVSVHSLWRKQNRDQLLRTTR